MCVLSPMAAMAATMRNFPDTVRERDISGLTIPDVCSREAATNPSTNQGKALEKLKCEAPSPVRAV